MNQFIQSTSNILGDQVVGRWLFMGLLASSIFTIVFSFYFLYFGVYNPVRNRLRFITGDKKSHSFFRKSSRVLGSYVVNKEMGGDLSYDQQRLLHAGYHSKNSLVQYHGIKILLTIGLPFIMYTLTLFFSNLSFISVLLLICSGFLLGFIGPSFYLDKMVEKRKKTIKNSFAGVIDDLIVCTEAGLGMDAGLLRVAKNTQLICEEMAYELNLVSAEMTTGVTREQALKNLVTRTGVEEIRGLTSALAQSMRFGSSISNTLRIFAEELRDKRMQNAEEEAAKLGVKMMLPLAFCFFPGIFIVILGPALLSVYATFVKL